MRNLHSTPAEDPSAYSAFPWQHQQCPDNFQSICLKVLEAQLHGNQGNQSVYKDEIHKPITYQDESLRRII